MKKTNDYEYIEKNKNIAREYLRGINKIDDNFVNTYWSNVAQLNYMFSTVLDNSLEDAMFMNGLAGVDCRHVDFSKLDPKNYTKIPFDSNTKFPEDVAGIFANILESRKKFNRDLEKLLNEGKVSGEEIHVAIMDQDIDVSLIDKTDMNIIHEEESTGHHYHGLTVCSLLASKSCGIAKGSEVHFYRKTDEKTNMVSTQFEKIIEYNKNCRKDSDKITVLSGSWSIDESDKFNGCDFKYWQERLREVGCELVCQNNFIKNFTEMNGNNVILNIDEEEKEKLSPIVIDKLNSVDLKSLIVIPIDRTYHQYGIAENNCFKYQPNYSNSWGIPQVAGLLALFKAKYKNLTFDDFCEIARDTAKERGIINLLGIDEEISKILEVAKGEDSIKNIEDDNEAR